MFWWGFLLKLDRSEYQYLHSFLEQLIIFISPKNYLFNIFRQYSLDYKLETYLKIARLYLEDDDPIQAESFINRASLLQV